MVIMELEVKSIIHEYYTNDPSGLIFNVHIEIMIKTFCMVTLNPLDAICSYYRPHIDKTKGSIVTIILLRYLLANIT